MGVRAVDAVVVASNARIAMGPDGANPRVSEQIALNATDDIVIGRRDCQLLGLHREKSDGIAAHLPRHAAAADDGHRRAGGAETDTPAEERDKITAGPERERAGIFEKELTLLREEQVEPKMPARSRSGPAVI